MIRHLFIAAILSVCLSASANDGVYFARGAQLIPVCESDISVAKEVLTIELGDDGYAKVCVDYDFMNNGSAKTVLMGFEAEKPYNTEDTLNPKGVHPYIHDFTVMMNAESLPYRNAVVEPGFLDSLYTGPKDDRPEEFEQYSYAYCFDAPFKEGMNHVRHTYRYRMSYGVGRTFEVPYWLTPAARWQGGVIGDFTLRICTPNTAKHFLMADSIFRGTEFQITRGTGRIRKSQYGCLKDITEIALRNGVVEWHKTDFRPTEDFCIQSADTYSSFDLKKYPVGTFYDRSDQFVIWPLECKIPKELARNLPYAHRGYVFKKKSLYRRFSKFWWYMPDPHWQPSTADFTPREWRLIKEGR